MSLEAKINQDLVVAMKSKDNVSLRTIRSIKTAIQVIKTDGTGTEITPDREVAILQKLVKQRRDSLDIFEKQGREDLAVLEREEIVILQKYLPTMLEGDALDAEIRNIIAATGATSGKDMGKVMGMATKTLAGKAEGKSISEAVKRLLG